MHWLQTLIRNREPLHATPLPQQTVVRSAFWSWSCLSSVDGYRFDSQTV